MKNLEILTKYARIVVEGSQMTELVLSCPRFTRNLTSRHAGCILCPPQIPTLTVHWSVIELGDTGGIALLCTSFIGQSHQEVRLDNCWTINSPHFNLGINLSGVYIFS